MKSKQLISSLDAGFGRRFRDIVLWGDKEGQIVTNYQEISEYVAERILSRIGYQEILEICCGIGSLTIFLAKTFPKVVAIDINPLRIKAAKTNLKVNNLLEKVTLLVSDAEDEKVLSMINTDYKIKAVCTDVTWSETGVYGQDHANDIRKTIPATDKLFSKFKKRGWGNLCMRLPKLINYDQLKKLGPVEIEEISINGEVKFVYAYYGRLRRTEGVTRKNFEINRK